MQNHMRAQRVCSRERRIALYKRSSINTPHVSKCLRLTHDEFVLLAVDDDGGDLLVHEDEDDRQGGGEGSRDGQPPRVVVTPRVDQPASVVTCRLHINHVID